MQVPRYPSARHSAEIESHVVSVRLQGPIQTQESVLRQMEKIQPFLGGQRFQTTDVSIGGDEQMPVVVREPVQDGEGVTASGEDVVS